MEETESPAADKPVSSVTSWKRSRNRTLELPSGHVVRVFNPGMKTFLVDGSIPNSLLSIAEGALQSGKPLSSEEMTKMMQDPKQVADMLRLIDGITMKVVVEPAIHQSPEVAADRSDDKLYIDDLDDEDKLYIFTWATGGPTDLEQFRAELEGTLATLQPGDNLEGSAIGTAGD